MARKGQPRPVENPDIEIGASLSAKRLRFRGKPETDVDLHGEVRVPEGTAEASTSSGNERENLPAEVEPGVTYRDVRIGWQASARLDDPAAEDAERAAEDGGAGGDGGRDR